MQKEVCMRGFLIIVVLTQIGLGLASATELEATAEFSFFHEEKETFRQTYKIDPGTPLKVYNANGEITVRVWNKDVVEVYALKKTRHGRDELEKVNIEVSTDDEMTIRTHYLKENARVSVNYTIHVPATVTIDRLETSNGEIVLSGTKGDARLITSNGEISVKNVTGSIHAETSNGEITIEGATGLASAVTSNGEITIRRTHTIKKAVTSNGSIDAEILNMPDDGTTIETSNGSITLRVIDTLNTDIKLITSLGSVSVHDVRVSVSTKSTTSLEGTLGKGGALLKAITSLGSIDVYTLK
jgi:hypothetical protein